MPEKPKKQVQLKPPLVLMQPACGEQPAVARTHSSMSTSQFGPSYLHHCYVTPSQPASSLQTPRTLDSASLGALRLL